MSENKKTWMEGAMLADVADSTRVPSVLSAKSISGTLGS